MSATRLAIASLLFASKMWAVTTYTVNVDTDTNFPFGTFNNTNSTGDLRGCLFHINGSGIADNYVINFDPLVSTINLEGILPPIGLNGLHSSITIEGQGSSSGRVTLNGSNSHPGLFVYLPSSGTSNTSIKNINIENTISEGGSGSGGAFSAVSFRC